MWFSSFCLRSLPPLRVAIIFLCCAIPLAAQPSPAMGLEWDVQSYRGTPYKATFTAGTYADLPSKASLERYCPTPGDQGPYGTCTAFAIAYHTRTILWGIQNRETSKTKLNAHLFSPSFIYEAIKKPDDTDCQGGSNPIVGLEYMATSGVPRLSTVPYNCGPTITTQALLEATEYPIKDYQILFLPDEENRDVRVNTVRKALSEGWPVVLMFIVPESFYDPPKIWKPLASDGGPSGKHGRHAMVVVGYDDKVGGDGAFRVLNSWSPKWCDGGYVWIPYDAFAQYALGAVQVYGERPPPPPEPPKPPKPSPQPGPKPPPAPAYHSLLEGRLEFQRNDGVAMPASHLAAEDTTEALSAYRLDRAYPSGTRFRFFLQTNTEVYLYAFASDLTRKVTPILPFADNMSPLIGPNSTLAFPSERKVVRMDNQPGTDYLLILYSSKKLDPDAIRAKMDATDGDFSTKIQAALGSQLVPKNQIQYDRSGVGFSVDRRASGAVVPLMIEIVHN